MGQNTSCNIPEPPQNQTTIQSNKMLTTRKKLHPLYYVQPKVYNMDEPNLTICTEKHIFLDHQDNENVDQKTLRQDQHGTSVEHKIEFFEDKEIIYKKIEVKWNKFIKMKRKNFTNDYDVVKSIGSGGFGIVYKVAMKSDKIYRAAKKIEKKTLKVQEHENLLAQMAIMMSMDHPNIAKLYEVYDQKSCYILILELCEGGQLFDRIVDHDVTEMQAKTIIKQILSALHYLHTKGIVHRDIKPENMLFEKKTKQVKIIDFGISIKIKPRQFLSQRVGTPYYIAPEVLLKRYNEKCDIWSLGIVMFMIIYNFPPFKGDNPLAVMQSISRDEINFRNPITFKYSYLALDFLKFLLNKNVTKRPSAFEALQHNWLEDTLSLKNTKDDDDEEKDKVLERMTKFHFKNKLEAVVYTYIVSQLLSSEERYSLLKVFKNLDKNNNGIIEISELQAALKNKKFFEMSEEKIKLLKDYLDTNCSGFIDYTQFLVGGIDLKSKIAEKHFQQAFAYFDIDNSGQITFEEVAKFLENQAASIEEIRALFHQVDKNNDGVISKIEFIQLLAHKKITAC